MDAVRARRRARVRRGPATPGDLRGLSDERRPTARPDGAGLGPVENLARLGAGVWWRTARWSVGDLAARRGAAPGRRRPRAADRPTPFARDPGLGAASPTRRRPCASAASGCSRRRRTSRYEQGSHPAYERILCELAPDEARILRLIAERGPQPAVDVRAGLAFVPGSRLIAQGFSMIGAEAGCRFVDQVPAYLSNLNRLGPDLVLARAGPRPRALPGARGPAGRARGPRRGGPVLARRPALASA